MGERDCVDKVVGWTETKLALEGDEEKIADEVFDKMSERA